MAQGPRKGLSLSPGADETKSPLKVELRADDLPRDPVPSLLLRPFRMGVPQGTVWILPRLQKCHQLARHLVK